MKKNYEAPSLEITKFEVEDVLNDSVIGSESTNNIHPGSVPSGSLETGTPEGPQNPV